jgi:hypothetical protein
MRCLADREVRQRRAFHEIAGGHIGCVGGGRCRRLLRGGRGAPPVPFARPDPFPQGPSRFFPGYRGAVRIRTIETGARAAMLSSSPRPWHRPRPLFRRPIFIRGEVVAWVCWSHRRSSCVGQTTWRSCSRKATRLGAARQQAPGLLPARVLTVVLIPWPVGA